MPTMRVHLVRHGQSTWNREGRLQGQTIHPALTELGRAQAAVAAASLAGVLDGPAALWSSDLVRAADTAAVIGTRLGLSVQYDEALREQALGALEGRLVRDLSPAPPPPGRRHPNEVRRGGGESLADVHRRVGRFLARELREAVAGRVRGVPHLVVVTHGQTARAAHAWLLGRTHRELAPEVVPNGSVASLWVLAERSDAGV